MKKENHTSFSLILGKMAITAAASETVTCSYGSCQSYQYSKKENRKAALSFVAE
jgi:hypothetical protein